MRRQERIGTKYDDGLDRKLDTNQTDLVNELLTPHVRLPETLGPKHKIVASYPVHQETQPVQARGRIVWNEAYSFQSRGPSFLDPIPDPRGLSDAR